jgi:Cu/Zn superoxide dismutase
VKSHVVFKVAFLAAVAAAALSASASTASGDPQNSITIAMHELNNSGQNGTATITDMGGEVRVTVSVAGEPESASEPSHVHFGRCPKIKAIPAYNVGPILKGKATSVVGLTWTEINSGKYVVMLHESAAALGTYVSCGNIGESAEPLALPTDESPY